MTQQEFLNNKYNSLCQELGDAQIKLDQISEHVKFLKSRIKLLNEAHPLIAEFTHIQNTASKAPNSPSNDSEL